MSLKLLYLIFSLNSHTSLDSIPALGQFKDEDIDTVIATYKEQTIAVKLKTGDTYLYSKDQWSKERVDDNHLARKIRHATFLLAATFTRAEHAPSFPGGDTAWQNYLQKVCSENQKLIKRQGPATIWVQFVVVFDGEIDQVTLITRDAPKKLSDLAIRMIREGPAWVPATQNGHNVSCWQKQQIDLQ